MYTILGEIAAKDDILLEGFLNDVSYNERETLKCMLKDFDVQMIEELLDVISEYKCFSNPTAQNLKTLLVEFAHVQLIQNPKYISACFGEIFSKHSIFSNVEEIMLTYEEVFEEVFDFEQN